LSERFRDPIHAIYGFVRLADEIVDSFHGYDKATLLTDYWADTHKAIAQGISLNPVLHSFQQIVHAYSINQELINTFLKSMEMDLMQKDHDQKSFDTYVHGSAEVVGLMCLKVFTENDNSLYEELKPYAMRLGATFQKVNFLRDMKSDSQDLGRNYFPDVDFRAFSADQKMKIESSIEDDFDYAYEGILQLPPDARFGVYIAYTYYRRLFEKIRHQPAEAIMTKRIRISNFKKYSLVLESYCKYNLNLI
jgi:15-cis-phytoene synthase